MIDTLESGRSCRICLDAEPFSDLFKPCLCDGSMCFVHRNCLQTWRRTTNNDDAVKQCMTCHFTYILQTTFLDSVCDRIIVIQNQIVFLLCRKGFDMILFLTVPFPVIMNVYEREQEQLEACFVQGFGIFVCGVLILFFMFIQSHSAAVEMREKCLSYKKITNFLIGISIMLIMIEPVAAFCIFSSVLDLWLWVYVVQNYKRMKHTRRVQEII